MKLLPTLSINRLGEVPAAIEGIMHLSVTIAAKGYSIACLELS